MSEQFLKSSTCDPYQARVEFQEYSPRGIGMTRKLHRNLGEPLLHGPARCDANFKGYFRLCF